MYSKAIRAGLLTVLMLFGCAAGAHAQEVEQTITPEKRALIKELFEVSGLTEESVNSVIDMMIAQNEKNLPNILAQTTSTNKTMTPEERADLEKKFRESAARAYRELKETLARLNYTQAVEDATASTIDKHFTASELKEWIAFYKTPVGKKMVELMPVMMSESMAKINESVLVRLQAEINRIFDEEKKLLEHDLVLVERLKQPPEPQPPAKAIKRRRRH
jgi:hypothetical protein